MATLPVPVVERTVAVTVEERAGPSTVPEALLHCLQNQQVTAEKIGC